MKQNYHFSYLTKTLAAIVLCLGLANISNAQTKRYLHGDGKNETNHSMFRPIDSWPTPNEYRSASGYPGPKYWQQEADYKIKAKLDTLNKAVSGTERITYHNNSPEKLSFLWLQLDQNVRSKKYSRTYEKQGALPEKLSERARRYLGRPKFDGGFKLTRVQLVDKNGKLVDADYYIDNTVMRVNLPNELNPGDIQQLEVDWSFKVPDNGRGAKEKVKDGWLYEIAQWYPRMSVYDDVNGWQTDQFLGRGEFYLEFGNFDVQLTVPASHIVQATGKLQNPEDVLTKTQRRRLKKALQSETPAYIIKPDEVMKPESRPKHGGMLTWHFKANHVRDFAWVSSRTYVWDAAGVKYNDNSAPIACYSLYPRVAMPLWNKINTRAIVQTVKTYGRMAFHYPYHKAVSVHGPVFGMEYPMIEFSGARPDPDGHYTKRLEHTLAMVTIHEVGHNWFPMIVDSDERKHTWMDEGLNTFLEYYAEQDFEKGFPSSRGPAKTIVNYMRNPNQDPIMMHSDLIRGFNFGNNGYGKPAAGLVMLREHILGKKNFDFAFHQYAKKWMYKHPKPADFFRSMEEGSGEDLSWFWRGWFYTNYANDQALTDVWNQPADSLIGNSDRGKNYWRIKIENKGGLILPVKMLVEFTDGTKERMDLPVDIWRDNEQSFTKGFFTDKDIEKVVLDPDQVMADIDTTNNIWTNPKLKRKENQHTN
ncbi:MAG TPA: M1 family metallopeptidase [Balneolales bacterium]|nr:M1 family metallopeptidase [Balneolales bacterium]